MWLWRLALRAKGHKVRMVEMPTRNASSTMPREFAPGTAATSPKIVVEGNVGVRNGAHESGGPRRSGGTRCLVHSRCEGREPSG